MLFDADRSLELFINQTGYAIWKLLDGHHDNQAILSHLNTAFSQTENLDEDLVTYIELLKQQALIEFEHTLETEVFSWHDESPLNFDISITGHCNLKCPFCFYSEAINTRPDLPISEWQTFFNELKSLAVREVTLSGGEILCRTDLFDLIDLVIAANLRFALLSNGTLGNERIISELMKPHRRCRLNSIQLSVDGSCPQIHDQIRGEGSFAATDKFLRLLKQAGLPVTVRMTVNRLNLHDIENTFAYLLDDIGLPSASVNSATQIGAAVSNVDIIDLSAQERLIAMQTLRRLDDEVWPGRIEAQAGPLYESRQFESMEQHKQHHPAYNGHLSACGCFRSKLAVHHDGIIIPCNMLGNVELGRINRDSIKKIWLEHPVLKKLASRTSVSLKSIDGCKDCEYVDICNGGCPADEISSTGNFFTPSISNCYRAFKNKINSPKTS
ncbi:MAG: PqqD family peptide modification chaperone [Candidatus Riflebacteria bacterium]|nr:PqqD family peptide modification chaperone [Candidatus Riflebacteria bacterium]